jgi:quinol monooxygenase YgiN
MNRQVIRYQTKPESTQHNTELVQNVFRELAAAAPGNVHYAVLRTDDGVFTHIVSYDNDGDNDVLTSLPAFKAFQNGGGDRRTGPPDCADVTIVGNYKMLAE